MKGVVKFVRTDGEDLNLDIEPGNGVRLENVLFVENLKLKQLGLRVRKNVFENGVALNLSGVLNLKWGRDDHTKRINMDA